MTTVNDCIDGLVLTNKLSRDQAAEIGKLVEKHQEAYSKTMTLSAAERAAAERAARELKAAKEKQKRQQAMQVLKAKEIGGNMISHPDGLGEGGISHLTKSKTAAPWSNVEYRMDSWKGILRGLFIDGIGEFRAKYAGLKQDKAGLKDFIEESYRLANDAAGKDTGNSVARGAARAWGDMTEVARNAANAAGADIKKRWNWVVPNIHNAKRVHQVSMEEWVMDLGPLNVEIMDEISGLPLQGKELHRALEEIYRTLQSGGLNKLEVTPFTGGQRKLSNRLGDPRTLQFNDAESWLAYNEKYGSADIFGMLMGHIDRMSRDISLLEVLGPNPDAMIRHMKKLIEESGEPDGVMRSKAEHVQVIFDILTGRMNSPVRELWYRGFGGVRNVLSMAILGRAPLSAISDVRFLAQTAGFNGIPSVKVLTSYLKAFKPANKADRVRLARMGIVAESWTSRGVASSRYQDELVGDGFTARMADSFHKVTGLTQMTEAGRRAFGQEFYGFLADNAAKALGELPKPLRRAFKRYGIDETLWDAARKADALEVEGVPFMDIAALASSADPQAMKAAQRIHEMVLEETDFAVPSPDARTRSLLAFGRRGTFWGEVVRSATMYKSFAVTVMHTHWMRGFMEAGKGRYGYLPSLMIGLTAMGAVALQAKEVTKGRDPRNMKSSEFWTAAFAQGGGLGIYGDFLYAWMSRSQGTALETAAGPVAQLALTDLPRLSIVNARQFYEGEDPGLAAELIRFVRRYMPGTSIWYAGLALDRMVFGQLQMMADPRYARNFARIERRAMKQYGQEYYWAPGDALPDRAPDIAGAVE